jgi:hypothetical protein
LSWLMRKREDAIINKGNLNCCITTLVALGADASLPFMVTPEITSTPNGLSLPYIALNSFEAIMCADCLLKAGARFLPTDPSPMCAAMKVVVPEIAVRVFYDNKRDGRIDARDVLKMDTDGNTAIHRFIDRPPRTSGGPDFAVELLNLMLEMGFSPVTITRDGTTALRLAGMQSGLRKNRTKSAILQRLTSVQLAHDRGMAVVTNEAMRNMPLSKDVIEIIWDRLTYGTITMEAATRASDRVRQN